ncbi:MAG: PH domain-containing protein [Caldisericia bacterium]
MFTNKRLILVDVQGLTGKKQEFLSILINQLLQC